MDFLNVWFFVKIIFLVAIAIYIFFAFVVVRQVYIMATTVKTRLEFIIKTIAWIHLLVSIGVFLFCLVIL